jgi:hypothetical protein
MPHVGPCIPASLLPLLLLEPASLPLPLPLAVPLLLPVAPLLLVLPLLLPPLVLPLPELPVPLLEPLLPLPELLMPPLPLPLLPPSSPPAVDDVPPHASGVATAVASDATKRNEIVFILHLLGPRESMEVKLSPRVHAVSRRSRSPLDPVCEMVILARA